jgi:hypothetical protein
MLSFSSFPMFAGSLAAGIFYTGMTFATSAIHTTANIALATADSVIGIVGGPWIQLPFRVVRNVAQPVTEKTVQAATLGISLVGGAVVGGVAYLGQTMTQRMSQKLKTDPKNEEWVVISAS